MFQGDNLRIFPGFITDTSTIRHRRRVVALLGRAAFAAKVFVGLQTDATFATRLHLLISGGVTKPCQGPGPLAREPLTWQHENAKKSYRRLSHHRPSRVDGHRGPNDARD